ncbi:MAG: hypothetical protein GWN73_04880, partial [Actinobacteria bacterium]|nr:hypothetical protein [Actinomycetota bacterium]NIU64798.1 hypothetical protein [Actinomycetota bacterium]NIW26599.1 hypothetical protein [Actinomycetota bacterium]
MTYQTGSDRAPHFSNPNVCVPVGLDCLPTGIAGAAENYRTGNYTAPIVSEFREAPIGLSITGSCPGEITASISGG